MAGLPAEKVHSSWHNEGVIPAVCHRLKRVILLSYFALLFLYI